MSQDKQSVKVERFRHIPDLHDKPHARLVPAENGCWVRYSEHHQEVERLEAERAEEQRIVNAQVSARISQLEDEKHRAIEAAADIGIEKRAFESVIDKTLKELKTRADRYDSDAGLANSERPSFAGSFLREAADLLRKKRDDVEPRQLDESFRSAVTAEFDRLMDDLGTDPDSVVEYRDHLGEAREDARQALRAAFELVTLEAEPLRDSASDVEGGEDGR